MESPIYSNDLDHGGTKQQQQQQRKNSSPSAGETIVAQTAATVLANNANNNMVSRVVYAPPCLTLRSHINCRRSLLAYYTLQIMPTQYEHSVTTARLQTLSSTVILSTRNSLLHGTPRPLTGSGHIKLTKCV